MLGCLRLSERSFSSQLEFSNCSWVDVGAVKKRTFHRIMDDSIIILCSSEVPPAFSGDLIDGWNTVILKLRYQQPTIVAFNLSLFYSGSAF
jgi:hypothetical protein